jgi:hypothetical protein
LALPPLFDQDKGTIFYDLFIFGRERVRLSNSRLFSVTPLTVKYGSYLTFVHLFYSGVIRSFPLCIFVSQKYLQSYYPDISLPIVRNCNDSSSANIVLVNPTDTKVTITSITFRRDAPSNIRLVLQRLPFICNPYSNNTVGKVILSEERMSDVETVVTIKVDLSHGLSESVEMKVDGYVEYGSFEPSESIINLVQTPENQKTVYFTNRFCVPVVVVSARTDSKDFRVVGFAPFVVSPGARSPDLKIKSIDGKGPKISAMETFLYVNTNATNHKIQIRRNNGQITEGNL